MFLFCLFYFADILHVLCFFPFVTLEEINSQIALEFGQAMTVKICKASGEVMPVVIVQNATVLDLKRAIQRYIQLKHQREGGIQHIKIGCDVLRDPVPCFIIGYIRAQNFRSQATSQALRVTRHQLPHPTLPLTLPLNTPS
uniref:SNRNP25 ubiquitin-like domain-containing protein n=1 Tax=Leptobrachium leishanense TaxID=445787 RepID=A0A8C5MX33_9ANUR